MDHSVKVTRKDERKGMRERLGPVQCLLAHRLGALWVPKVPQGLGVDEPTADPGVVAKEERVRAALLRFIEGQPLLALFTGLGVLAEVIQGFPLHHVRP